MATVEKKTHNVAKFYRGELFDLTITSGNNRFGKEKIVHSWNNGINFKMEYFIEELNKITISDENDENDKNIKRKKRKEFLELCNSIDILKKLFNLLINYLNGGQTLSMKNEYNNQSLIVVLMGGNIINIYFNIIYIIKFKSYIDITIKNISNIFNDITNFTDEFSIVLHSLKDYYSENPDFKTNMESFKDTKIFDSYSDLDFALLPNNLDKMEVDGGGSRVKKPPDRFEPTSETKPKSRKSKKTTKTTKTKTTKAKKTIEKKRAKPNNAKIPKKKYRRIGICKWIFII